MKTKILTIGAAVASLFSIVLVTAVNAQSYEPGELIVMVEKGVNPAAITGTVARATQGSIDLKVAEALSERAGIYLITFDEQTLNGEALLKQISRTVGVKAAQFNYHVTMRETIPNDPEFNAQWHHRNTGQTGGTAGADVRTTEAWDITTGGQTTDNDDIVVAIIEGANMNHPDLTANHWVNTQEIPGNGIDDDGNGYVDDYLGWNPVQNNDNVLSGNHGTNVAGMIGAQGNNGLGAVGANWNVKMMVVTVGSLTTANVLASYGYAYEMRVRYNDSNGATGAFVVATNSSWGIDNANPANFPVWCEFYDVMGEAGILSCGATANNNVNIDQVGDMPTGCLSPYMVAVTATNHNDVRTFSGFGTTSINVAAPGASVRTTSGTSGYTTTSGTSFATPLTAGVIALLYSAPCQSFMNLVKQNPQAGADLIRQVLYDGVDVIPNLINEVSTGGRINAATSLNLLLAACNDNPCQPIVSASTNEDCAANAFSIELQIDNNEVVGQYNVLASVNGGAPSTVVNNQPAGTYTFGNYPLGSTVNLTVQFVGDNDCNVNINNITNAPIAFGCTNADACNYNPDAVCDNGSCITDAAWYLDADGDGYGDENDTNPLCENPCDGTLNVSISSTGWLDEVTWTLSDADGAAILTGGPYGNTGGGGSFNAQVQSTNGPFSFSINTQGQFNDNAPTYTISTGTGYVLASATQPGGTDTTLEGILCSFANNNLDCDDNNAIANPDNPAACGDDPEPEPEPCDEQSVQVVGPAALEGALTFSSAEDSGWGAALASVSINATAILAEDGAAGNLGCNAFNNASQINGNIAVAYRGTCQFSQKALNAQNAGAQALVIINNAAGVIPMAPGDAAAQITIPVVMISQADGQLLLNALNAGELIMFIGNGCAEDCAGIAGGSAFIDACGNCVGGTTGNTSISGCTDVNACNYDPTATCDDGSCLAFDACGNCGGSATAGCTDTNACNYDPIATCDDGLCEYDSCAGCMGDFDDDNMRTVNDLLIMMSEFGCELNCATDMNDDGLVNGQDVVMFLAVFAIPCD